MRPCQIIFAIIILVTATSGTLKATHMIGGQITATPVSNQAFTYRILFTAYTDPDADVEFGNVEINFGHGDPINIDGENDFRRKIASEDSLYSIDTLVITHTFPGAGKYLISMREFNRSAEVVNMLNSVNTPFYVETLLTIASEIGENSTPHLSDSLVFSAHVKTRFVHSIGATDPDGDSLSYTLTVPKQDVDRTVDRYIHPDRFDTLFAENPGQENGSFPPIFAVENGQLIWDAPTYGGEYAAAFRVQEWRKIDGEWEQIGYVTRDLLIFVQDTVNNTNGGDYVDFVTSTEGEYTGQAINLFPNPTDGKFHVKIEDTWVDSQIWVHDISGKTVYEATAGQDEVILEIPHLSQGIYVLTLQKGFKKRSFTFVKQ